MRLDEKQPLIIDFRGEQEQVTSVTLNGGDIPYEVKDEHIVIASDWVAVGENRVAIAFTPADQSLNRRDEFLYTLLVPDRARTVFPCFDQPDMKSLFTLTLEVPSTWQAVANGAITQTDSTGVSGRNRISFKETEPLSTYLFSFVAGELTREVYSRNGRDISIYHRETDPKKIAQCPAIADEVFDALEWQEDFTGIPYPFAKYDVIILPGFQYGGMEHTGATLYTDRRMFLDDDVFPIVLKNTLVFAILSGPAGFLLSFLLAWFVNEFNPKVRTLLSFMFYIKEHPCIPLNKEEQECMMEYHSFLWKKVKMRDNAFRKEIAKGIIAAMFYDIYNFCRKHMPANEIRPKSRKEELFEKFMREVSANYKIDRSVTFYANKLCLTPKHLSGVVKEVSGKTAGEWIDNFVILEARALLKSSEMSVQEIAEYLHFANQSFFGKYFKHYVGMSPKEYRRS